MRKRDLIMLGGDVGAGKSALALAMAVRAAAANRSVVVLSGEMDETRLLERALAIEAKVEVDSMRTGSVPDERRSSVGAAALRLSKLPLHFESITGNSIEETVAAAWEYDPELVVVDSLQILSGPGTKATLEENSAAAILNLKTIALKHEVALLVVAHLPGFERERSDLRPAPDDFGALGAVKHHSDVILGLYREEMYRPEKGVEGAAELIVVKNRNGPTGFIDLYFHHRWMRFEDMLDPE